MELAKLDLIHLTFKYLSFKADNDKKNFEKLIEAIKESKKGKTVGVFAKDAKLSGQFLVILMSGILRSRINLVPSETGILEEKKNTRE